MLELQRRLEAAGSDVTAHGAHPGYAATNLQGHTTHPVDRLVMRITNRVIAQRDEMGALPILFAATQDLPPGSYTGPGGLQEMRGHPKAAGRSVAACDTDAAQRLWDVSEQLTGVRFALTLAAV